MEDDHPVTGIDELSRLDPVLIPYVLVLHIEGLTDLAWASRMLFLKAPDAPMQLDIRIDQIRIRDPGPIPEPQEVKCTLHDLQVLLRHRPRSIARNVAGLAGVPLTLPRNLGMDRAAAAAHSCPTMRKIINSTYISLEGVVERPQEWPSVGDRGTKGDEIQAELLLACDALLMGRRTYEGFAPVWPTRSGDPVSDRINSMKKYVVSSNLTNPEWANTSVISGNPVDEIRRLKEAPGRDIVQYGFGRLSSTMLEHGLLDELRLWVYPLFVGDTGPDDLLQPHVRRASLELTDTSRLENGVVILSYQVSAADGDRK